MSHDKLIHDLQEEIAEQKKQLTIEKIYNAGFYKIDADKDARIAALEKVADAIECQYAIYGEGCFPPEIESAMRAAGYLEEQGA